MVKHYLLAVLALGLSFSAFADEAGTEFISGGINYRINDDLKSVTVIANDPVYSGDIVIPAKANGYDVTKIETSAFRCSEVRSVSMPNSVTEIGAFAFQSCMSLEEIRFSGGMTVIPSYTLGGCPALKKIYIPKSIKQINEEAVNMNYGENTGIYIEDIDAWYNIKFNGWGTMLLMFGADLYLNEELVTEVKFSPNTSETFSTYFVGCKSIETLELLEGVETIESGALNNLTNLKTVKLPASLTTINSTYYMSLFSGSENIKEIVCKATTPPTCTGSLFGSYPGGIKIKVPESAVDAYKSADIWKEYRDLIEAIVEPTDGEKLPYEVSVEDLSVTKGGTATIPICLNNEGEVITFQCDMELPEGVTVETDEDGDYMIDFAGRTDKTHVVTYSSIGNKVRIVCYSAKNHAFSGTEGALVNVPVVVSETAGVGDVLQLKLTNILLTKSGTFEEVALPDVSANLTVKPSFTIGDVNNDGKFTAADISLTVEYVLGNSPATGISEAADANGDGKFTAADIAIVVSKVLSIE